MRKSLLLSFAFALIVSIGLSQSQRKVLLEHFTQASCGPCATYNPQINSLLNSNPDKITAIMYHTSWPGYDPMYNHNTVENAARTGYYSVISVPNSVVDGNVYNGHPNGWNITTVNNRYDEPSPAELSIYHELSPDNSTIHVTMLIEATENIASGTKAQLAIVEETIQFSSPPGSNGETVFHNVMKKMLPNQTGINLPTIAAGDYMILEYSWDLENVYDVNELAAVGFLQNNTSKEVLQAEISSETVFPALYSVDADIKDITNVPLSFCSGGYVKPHVTVRNNGSETLTSIDISYSVNGGDPVTTNWTGNLGFLESEEIELDETNFTLENINDFTFEVTSTNGEEDEYTNNNSLTVDVPRYSDVTSPIVLVLKLDNHPEETSWEVKDSNENVIFSGGPYSNPGQNLMEVMDLPNTGCYTFSIFDSGGDGLTEGGSYVLGDDDNLYIAEGNSFGSMDFAQFGVLYTDVKSPSDLLSWNISPNPASDYVRVDYQMKSDQQIKFELLNVLGEVVFNKIIPARSSGQFSEIIDISDFDNGLYFLNANLANEKITQKIVITK